MEIKFKGMQPVVEELQSFGFLERLTQGYTGYIGLTLIGTNGKICTGFGTAADLGEELETGSFFTDLIKYGRERWNIYVSVGAFSELPVKGSRGYASQVGEIPGVWADFDVKPGQADAFQSVEELEEFLEKLPPMTMRVDTGSGGVHGYWLFAKPMTDMTKASRLLSAWHAYLAAEAGDKQIDNVQELARILRVAGTIRWPKKGDDLTAVPVTVQLRYRNGPEYTPEDLMKLAGPALRVRVREQREKVAKWQSARQARQEALKASGVYKREQARDDWERTFNTRQDWSDLLERAGWKLAKDNRRGGGTTACRYWSQPGMTSGYSAMTDFGDSDLIVFYTTHPDWDAVSVPHLTDRAGRRMSTKFYFALGALYAGDEKALLLDIAHGGGVIS